MRRFYLLFIITTYIIIFSGCGESESDNSGTSSIKEDGYLYTTIAEYENTEIAHLTLNNMTLYNATVENIGESNPAIKDITQRIADAKAERDRELDPENDGILDVLNYYDKPTDSELRNLYIERAIAFKQIGEYELAFLDFTLPTYVYYQDDYYLYLKRGDLFLEDLKQFKLATIDYTKAIELYSSSDSYTEATLYKKRASSYMYQEKLLLAEDDFKRAIDIALDDSEENYSLIGSLYAMLVFLYYNSNQIDLAVSSAYRAEEYGYSHGVTYLQERGVEL